MAEKSLTAREAACEVLAGEHADVLRESVALISTRQSVIAMSAINAAAYAMAVRALQ